LTGPSANNTCASTDGPVKPNHDDWGDDGQGDSITSEIAQNDPSPRRRLMW
jgi:hypothetical protein